MLGLHLLHLQRAVPLTWNGPLSIQLENDFNLTDHSHKKIRYICINEFIQLTATTAKFNKF